MDVFVRQAKVAGGPGGAVRLAPQVVLVPLLNMGLAGDMLGLAAHLTRDIERVDRGEVGPTGNGDPAQARIVVLSVVVVPPDQPLTMGLDMARSYRALLDFLSSRVETGSRHVRVDRIVKVARNVAEAIRQAAEEERADLVLLYWKGYAREPKQHLYGRVIDGVLVDPPCRVMPARVEGWNLGRRILLPVRGGPAAEEALDLGVGLAEGLDVPLTVLHNVPRTPTVPNLERAGGVPAKEAGASVSQVEALGEEPYLVFNEQLRNVREETGVRIESILTRVEDPAQAILSEAQADDIVMMGLGPQGEGGGGGGESLARQVSAAKGPPLLLLSTPVEMDLRAYNRQMRAREPGRKGRGKGGHWSDMPFEHWFVEHTFHGDEFRDPEEFLRVKRASGQTMSVVVLTSNEAARIHSVLMGLRKVLQEMHPVADQIVVVDAGSSDGTPELARELGVEVYDAAEILAEQGDLHGRGESWWKSLAVAKGDLVVWLDPRARRFHPSTALALAGPLLRVPTLRLVKAFSGTTDDRRPTTARKERKGGDDFSPVDMSWGGFVVPRRGEGAAHPQVRVQALRPQDLLALDGSQVASLPPRTLFQVLCPSLAGVIAPFGRDVAARREAMLGLPVFAGESLELGLLLSVASEFGTNAIAQVELGEGRPAPPPAPGLRGAVELLQVMSRRLQDAGMRRYAERIAERLKDEMEGNRTTSDVFEVRALGPVERPPMRLGLRTED